MDGFLGEIRLWGCRKAPENWAFCMGQQLVISRYPDLYAIIGTIYGGDDKEVFNLPDLRGKIVLGTGQGPELSERKLGSTGGSDDKVVNSSNLAVHTHLLEFATGSGTAQNQTCLNDIGTENSPEGNYPALSTIARNYASQPTKDAYMSSSFRGSDVPVKTSAINDTGDSKSFTTRTPYLTVYYIICTNGVFPVRRN